MGIIIARNKSFRHWLLIGAAALMSIGAVMWSVSVRWQFVYAAREGDIATVKRMLDAGMDPDIVSHIGGIRAISTAAYSGHIQVVQLLLDRGSNPSYGLPQAILMDRPEIVRILIERGANVQRWDGYESTPLQFAQNRGNKKIIGLLRSAGAK